ncbi:hypothetical protein AS156_27810 [Bradyrhizobium macuxiense]|uniref:Lipoprotein n=2 Tax=Bradyrhizobium macuxiense TaxID=1755647 RepID=A0A125QAL9_9BRAD|nr:hypothetical protein AS156_27810 [Bradyrhizobium macuxiense]
MSMKNIFALCAALLLACCQTAEPPSTASGKPEVTIRASVSKIKALLITHAMNNGLSITKDTEYLLQFDKPTTNVGATLLLGSRYAGTPNERYVITFAPLGEETRVIASAMFVTNPGSGFEQLTPVNAGPGIDQTQRDLQQIKAMAETPDTSVAAAKPGAKPRAVTR